MTNFVGVLAEATTTTVSTTTVGTVPANKAWVFKIQYAMQANAGGATVLTIAVNGVNVLVNSIASSAYAHSSKAAMLEENATYPTGEGDDTVVAPGPITYYASAGDTITYTLGTNAAQSMNIQLVGSSLDV